MSDMNLLKNPEIDNHPLVQCIQKTDILCNFNKKVLYKELKISWLSRLQYIINKEMSLPSQEKEIKKVFEKVLPQNENSVNNLIKEYTAIKNSTSL